MTTTMTPSGLKLHEYTDTDWPTQWLFNINRLHYTLLKANAMGDVVITSIENRDALKWDDSAQKYVNYSPLGSTTTTTSTTSTTSSTSTSTSSTSTSSSTSSTTATSAPGTTTTQAPTSTTSTTTTTSTTATFTTTTAIPAPEYEAKSVILDIADNYSGTNWTGIRSIDFWYQGSKVANVAPTDFAAYVTSYSSLDYLPEKAVDTSLSKTGTATATSWQTAFFVDQRLSIVFTNLTTFDEIRINNFHNSGGSTLYGSKNVKIHFSTDAIASVVYDEAISNSTLIFDGIFDEHIASDIEDEQILSLGVATTTSTTTTTIAPAETFTAKSIIIEADGDNWGDATYISFRQMDFYFEGSKIANLYSTDFLSYDTANIGYPARYVFDTTTLYTGDVTSNGFLALLAPSRLICVFNTPTEFDSIVINNAHQNGGITARGIQNARIYMSDDAITDTVVGNPIANSTLLFDGVFDEHAAANAQDDQILPIYAYPVTTTTTTTTTSSTTSTTTPPLPGWDARSVIFDIADNYSGATYMGIRSIEFFDNDTLVAFAIGDVNIYYTTQLTTSYSAENAFDQTKAKDGGYTGTAWISGSGQVTNQRLVIDFTESVHFNSIVINNHHNSGGETQHGAENVEINISTDAISDNTYGAAISNSTLIYDSTFDQHAASSAADDQILILIP